MLHSLIQTLIFGTKMLVTMIFLITNIKCEINLILMKMSHMICNVKKDRGRENKLYITNLINGLKVKKGHIRRTWPSIPGFKDYLVQRKTVYL